MFQEKAQAQLLLNLQQRLDQHGASLGNQVDRQNALTMLAHQLENRKNKLANTQQPKPITNVKLINNNNSVDETVQQPLSVMIPDGSGQYALGQQDLQHAATNQQILLPFLRMSDQLRTGEPVDQEYSSLDMVPAVGGDVSFVSPGLPPSPASPPGSASSPCSTHSSSSNTSSDSSNCCDGSTDGSLPMTSSDESTTTDDSNIGEDVDYNRSGPASRHASGASTPVIYVSELDQHIPICTTDTEAATPPRTPMVLLPPHATASSLSAAMEAAVFDTAAFDTDAMELAAMETAANQKWPVISMEGAQSSMKNNWSKMQRLPCDGAEMDSPASPTPPETLTPPNTPPSEPLEIPITAISCSVAIPEHTTTSKCF